jgi:uncharacterized membrane protein HdeD (DUF308 family)
MKTMSYRPEIIALKFADIFLLSAYYVVAALLISAGIDAVIGKFDKHVDEQKSTVRLFVEAILYVFVLLIIFYIVRNIIERIPFPFEGWFGFQHSRVKERTGDVIFVFILFYFQNYFTEKLDFLHSRMMTHFTRTT